MDLAIVAAAVRLPGAPTIADFWNSLLDRRIAFERYTGQQLDDLGVPSDVRSHPRFVPVGSFLEDADGIDLEAFALSAGEAGQIDPQHRLILELGREALLASGLDGGVETVGTYVSATASSYLHTRVLPTRPFNVHSVHYPTMLGNEKDFAAARLAHKLGLRGPALSVQTACSSSLVAVHQAGLALNAGTIDAAVVAGASITVPQRGGYLYSEGGVLSPLGRCRPFDTAADGTIKGNGGGAVVLMRLDQAQRTGRDIIAVIRGIAVNNDGSDKAGFTAPSIGGQTEVITAALTAANTPASAIGYVEAHGTATRIGDPIEVRALHRAHRETGETSAQLGSTKANFGHLDAAAGVIGLIKTALVARTGIVPALANFSAPNPDLRLHRTRFTIPTETTSLHQDAPLTAVSSFGMGGTNAHAIIGPPPIATITPSESPVTVTINARTAESLTEYARRLADHLRLDPTIAPTDVAATVGAPGSGDLDGASRRHVTVTTSAELITTMEAIASGKHDDFPTATHAQKATGRHVWLPTEPAALTHVDLPAPASNLPADTASPTSDASRDEREEIEDCILTVIRAHLGEKTATRDDDFFELGGESMMLVDIVADISEDYRVKIAFDALDGATGIDTIVTVIADQIKPTNPRVSARSSQYVLRLESSHHRPFYMHPPAGGTNFCYVDLHRAVPEIAINAFRADLDATGDSIEAIAARCIAQIPRHSVGLRLGGYSFGGNVAMEMALQLEDRGDTVDEVVLFDAHVPTSYRGSGISDDQYDQALATLLRSAVGQHASSPAAALAALGRGDDSTIAEEFLELWKQNHKALTQHRLQRATNARLTVFRATEPHPTEELELLGMHEVDKARWADYTTAGIRLIDVPGNHYTMFTSPQHRDALAHHWRAAFSDTVSTSSKR